MYVRILGKVKDIVDGVRGNREMKDLKSLQNLALEMASIRGFSKDSLRDKCLVLMEECGELAKAVLRGRGNAKIELADVLAVILMIAWLLGMDGDELERVYIEKIEKDKLRL